MYDPKTHHRRSIRLRAYDYAQHGAYFVTVVSEDRACLFGEVVEAEMRPNVIGQIVQEEWARTAMMRPRVALDEFIVMPNHIHGIIRLVGRRSTFERAPTTEQFGKPTPDSIPTIIRLFKAASAKRINKIRDILGMAVWQRNYYEHVIRHEDELNKIREYIRTNPLRWDLDRENVFGQSRHEEREPWE